MTFKVIDKKTGKEPTVRVIDNIARKHNLKVCDIDQFYLGEDGSIVLADCCGRIAYVDTKRFSIALEQEPCEDDCIGRQATVKRLCKVADFMNEKREGLGSPYVMAALLIQDNKEEFPSVNPKPKTGHWIRMKAYEKWGCSECHTVFRFTFKEHDYCPNCGAKMG